MKWRVYLDSTVLQNDGLTDMLAVERIVIPIAMIVSKDAFYARLNEKIAT